MDTLLLMDLVIICFGVYMLYVSMTMKQTNKIHPILFADEELKHCKKQEELVAYIAPRMFAFAIITSLDGVVGIVSELFVTERILQFIFMVIFLISFIWFTKCLKKAREKFC